MKVRNLSNLKEIYLKNTLLEILMYFFGGVAFVIGGSEFFLLVGIIYIIVNITEYIIKKERAEY